MIPAAVIDLILPAAAVLACIGIGLAILILAGLLLVQTCEIIDYFKRRAQARRFFNQFKEEDIRREIDLAKQQDELRRI